MKYFFSHNSKTLPDASLVRHYIENYTRIYRDGSTDRFLSDVVSLLNGGERDCPKDDSEDNGFEPITSLEEFSLQNYVVIVFDATENPKQR